MTDWTVVSLADAIRAKTISPVEATRAYLDRIARLDGAIRSFLTVDADGALAAARALEADAVAGRWRGPLHGVPLAYKDLCHIHGLPSSCGTKTAEYFTSAQECTAVRRLRDAGAVTLGKLNMTELALGPFGDNAHHGDVQNPWRRGHVSGGSSSGSGAAVAAGFAAGALGSDTGGSIRLPAAACGIVGLKPTYGRVSRAGVMPLSWSLDHLGPMTRTVRDAAVMLGIIAGHDPHDATTSRRRVQAARLRARLARQFIAAVFAEVDVLVAPTIPESPPLLADVKQGSVEEFVQRMGRFSRLTRPFNALGLPVLSVPCGFSGDGRPFALQIVGRPFAEATILRLGHAYQRITDWHMRRPPLD